MYQASLVTDLSLVRLFRDSGRKSQNLNLSGHSAVQTSDFITPLVHTI